MKDLEWVNGEQVEPEGSWSEQGLRVQESSEQKVQGAGSRSKFLGVKELVKDAQNGV